MVAGLNIWAKGIHSNVAEGCLGLAELFIVCIYFLQISRKVSGTKMFQLLLLIFFLSFHSKHCLSITSTGSRPTGLYLATSYGGKSGLIVTARPSNDLDRYQESQDEEVEKDDGHQVISFS